MLAEGRKGGAGFESLSPAPRVTARFQQRVAHFTTRKGKEVRGKA
jgi:hypothetical protein